MRPSPIIYFKFIHTQNWTFTKRITLKQNEQKYAVAIIYRLWTQIELSKIIGGPALNYAHWFVGLECSLTVSLNPEPIVIENLVYCWTSVETGRAKNFLPKTGHYEVFNFFLFMKRPVYSTTSGSWIFHIASLCSRKLKFWWKFILHKLYYII